MGWWKVPEVADATTGDAVLDSVRHFLRAVSREYQQDLSRKPTLRELEYALTLAFKVNVGCDILDGVDQLDVRQVVMKTARRPKRHTVAPGDIFAYRLEDGRFGFGRVVSLASVGAFAEIFDYFSDQPVFDYSKLDTWLVPPVPIESYALLETGSIGDWRTIGHTPDFVPGPRFACLRYRYGSTPNTLMAIDIYGNKAPVSAAEADGLQEYASYDDFTLNEFIASHLLQKREK
ncbi:Imm26 family immunity protein [Massilia rubra]|uniref:Uncharacterized protein n=1 Tax=Massilia rubra TaxID=2607910 RepID=A0ABX0LPV8_9BURK|nr:Imm26 family immunity protein [Massilia rubra]NHZ36913.1 hypothetical protein [Massilia rubra]